MLEAPPLEWAIIGIALALIAALFPMRQTPKARPKRAPDQAQHADLPAEQSRPAPTTGVLQNGNEGVFRSLDAFCSRGSGDFAMRAREATSAERYLLWVRISARLHRQMGFTDEAAAVVAWEIVEAVGESGWGPIAPDES